MDHLRLGDPALIALLERGAVLMHRFILGELALGALANRDVLIASMRALPQSTVASIEEVMGFIGRQRLHGLGIGYVDAHLLAAARLTPEARLRTRDERLSAIAAQMQLSFC